MTRVATHEEPFSTASGSESPEYTSGDFEDEDPDEDTYISMRRFSRVRAHGDSSIIADGTGERIDDGLASPTGAVALALKEQFQQQLHQIQQAMALHLQNLPHLPHLPQMPQMPQMPAFPGMPMLPDYQAYLQQAPFVRRMQQLMPGMNGDRPDTDGTSDQKMDAPWWDLSSYMNTGATPPPAYEDIFPQKDLDRKQASAAQAAAEAEADMKCATLYDEPATTSKDNITATPTEEVRTKTIVPDVLQIGRKHEITREQQEQFLQAREQKLKKIGSDRKLFFVWIPLLLLVLSSVLYNYIPSVVLFLWSIARAVMQDGPSSILFGFEQNRPLAAPGPVVGH
jgi:hypothetical protein